MNQEIADHPPRSLAGRAGTQEAGQHRGGSGNLAGGPWACGKKWLWVKTNGIPFWLVGEFTTHCSHRCAFWLFWQKNRWPWFTWWFNHLPGPSIPPKRTPMIVVYSSGWIGMFSGGTIWILTHGQIGVDVFMSPGPLGGSWASCWLTKEEFKKRKEMKVKGIKSKDKKDRYRGRINPLYLTWNYLDSSLV